MNQENKNVRFTSAGSGVTRRPTLREPFREVQNEKTTSPLHKKRPAKSTDRIKLQEAQRLQLRQIFTASPVLPSTSTVNNIPRHVTVPAVKRTLLKARRARIASTAAEKVPSENVLLMYNDEYLSENFQQSLKIDRNYIVPRNFLYKLNSHLSSEDRCKILHWIYVIADSIGLSEINYFKFVRMFDGILEKMYVSKGMLRLVAIVAGWILIKMHEVKVLTATRILHICCNAYTIAQINAMERKLLGWTGFNLIISTPSDFYYSFDNSQELFKHCMNYILELFSFHLNYSQFSSRGLASAAGYLSEHYLKLNIVSKHVTTFETFDSVREIAFLLDFQLRKVQVTINNDRFKAIFDKYNDSDHLRISRRLKEIISTSHVNDIHKFLYA